MPPRPALTEATPAAISPNPPGSWSMTIQGNGLEPPARIFGVNDYTFNTNGSKFYYVALQLRTTSGMQAAHKCSQGNYWDSDNCAFNSLGNFSFSIQLNPITWPDWRNGVEMLVTWHLLIPSGAGTADLASNTLRVPFSRNLKDSPAIVSLTPNGFQSDTKSWLIQIQARNLDLTSNAIIDGVAVTPDSVPAVDDVGNGVLSITLPQASRSKGNHTIKVCRWIQDISGPGQTANCSTVANFGVTQIYEKMNTPAVAAVGREAVRATPPAAGAGNMRIAAPAANSPALHATAPAAAVNTPVVVTVTCASTPLFADSKLTPLSVQGKAVVAQKGQKFTAAPGTIQTPQGKTLRQLVQNPTAFIDASCVQ